MLLCSLKLVLTVIMSLKENALIQSKVGVNSDHVLKGELFSGQKLVFSYL